ncbi:MAG: ATP-binding protein, partial [Verrucomicrobiota bacterium]
ESLGVMAGGVAHSLNNLLTSIMGNASLLLDDLPEGVDGVRRIQKMEQCAEHAKELCQKMLSFSGQGNLVVEPIDLNAIAMDCKGLVEVSLPRTIRSNFSLKEDLSKVEADPSELQQLVLNLAMNAAEAMNGKEWGQLSVRSGEIDLDQKGLSGLLNGQNANAGKFVYLEVEDEGHGMSSDVLERAFDPFFTTKFKGRGLGLSAVQGIANAHDGAIEISSDIDEGTRIRVYLPALVESKEAGVREGKCVSRKVLIAEDEDVLRMVVSSMVASYGYEVVQAVDGVEAFKMYQENKDEFVLAMVDLNMPRMDGGRLYRAIREENEHLPIVLMSGDNDEVTMPFEDCAKERCHFMHKPFGMEQLKRSFRILLEATEASVAEVV